MPAHKYENFMRVMQYAIDKLHVALYYLASIHQILTERWIKTDDKLDRVLAELKELRAENAQFRKEIDNLKIGIWWSVEAHIAIMERHGDWIDVIMSKN